MVETDYYEVLGISKNSDAVVVQAAYKALMRKYHPDINKNDDAHEKSILINEAFYVLNDPDKRRQYDADMNSYNENSSFDLNEDDRIDRDISVDFEEFTYRQVCELVFDNQKASTSWVQRNAGIGYNTAAKFIERMEAEGLIGPSDHLGRREIFNHLWFGTMDGINTPSYQSDRNGDLSIFRKIKSFYFSAWGIKS